ncbi:DUF92 domain-containing protein [Bacillus rubiinfantis]|uniref:DUF92 domain-containing protein n=1 Tax=Bacillus rubiinfantis TaxID=1499680 RepID=UPI0005AA8B64|nr:DUF92 domain-containing protein [Bacillus rubiinfantis]
MMDVIFVIILIIIVGILGYLVKSLSLSGAFAAMMIGVTVYIGFQVKGLILLGVFFASSSFWSKYKSSVKKPIEDKLAKGATRDWRQVFANGGAAALFSLFYSISMDSFWVIGFVVALASANSDTWASEIGSLSKKNPIYILTGKRVEKGTSGAVSGLGSIAGLSGSLLVAVVGVYFFQMSTISAILIFLFGFIGNIIDTLLGAVCQQLFRCTSCGIETEKRIHCDQPTVRIKGLALIDNDMVNFLSGFIASILAIGFFTLFLSL